MTDKTAWEGHTPLPWEYDPEGPSIFSRHIDGWSGLPVQIVNLYGAMGGDDADADVALIIHCVNNFPALEAERDALREALSGMLTFYGMDEDPHHETQRVVHNAARQALALSEKSE